MTDEQRKALIQKYKDGYRAVAEALAGADDKQLDARPAPEKWSAREIVHHLADSEMTSAIRLRLLLVEDRPAIKGYDQEAFARKLFYDRPYEASLEAFRYARETTSQILQRMTAADWAREGTHTEVGAYSAETWLQIYADHAHNHADQIRRARAAAV
jgi:DinB superfamily